jgi:hypothetical protein
MTIREAIAAAHPTEPELQWDVLSSACHAANAETKSESADPAIASFRKIESIIAQLPANALAINKDKLFYANRVAALLGSAATRWPAQIATFRETATIASAKLLEGLPEDQKQPLRSRLTLPGK